MSHALQTRKLFERDSDENDGLPPDDPLRREFGWGEVAVGLNRVMLGYLLSFVCFLLIIVLAIVAIVLAKQLISGDLKNVSVGMVWILFGGIGLITLLSLASYIMILAGKIRCAVHTPDRCGARWMIFTCILCLVVGPVLNFMSGFIPADQRGVEELQSKMMREDFRLEDHREELLAELWGPTFRVKFLMSVVGAVVGTMASIFFVLFFRAIGTCFKENRLIAATEFYLLYSLVLVGASGFILWNAFAGQIEPLLILGMLIGWFVNLIWYVFLVFFTRCVILSYCRDIKHSQMDS